MSKTLIWCGFAQFYLFFNSHFPKKPHFFGGHQVVKFGYPNNMLAYFITSTICRIEEKTKIDDKEDKVLGK
jgi:hypothetical protein